MQSTIKNTLEIKGVGLHSGEQVTMKILPSESNTGIVFKRVDILDNEENLISASYDLVRDTKLCTMLINDFGNNVGTIEHLMSALSYLRIDNALIEIDNFEIPILDGSACIFIDKILEIGIKYLDEPRKILRILKPVELKTEKWIVSLFPSDRFILNVTIEFNNIIIGKQSHRFDMELDDYKEEISRARTFCLEQEIAYLQSAGLALGGSLDNAVVVGKERVLNPEGLRYETEFVRHKLLDAVGDLYLAGYYIRGEFSGYRCGHEANNLLLREIFKDPSCYQIETEYYDIKDPLIFSTRSTSVGKL